MALKSSSKSKSRVIAYYVTFRVHPTSTADAVAKNVRYFAMGRNVDEAVGAALNRVSSTAGIDTFVRVVSAVPAFERDPSSFEPFAIPA